MHRTLVLAAMLACLFAAPLRAAEPYAMRGLVLLQPDAVFRERVSGGAPAMQAYIEAVNAEAARIVEGSEPQRPSAGFIVLAVRPGGRSKIWLDFWPLLPSRTEERLLPTLEKIKPFAARGGTIVFAISASLWGAPPTSEKAPRPNEWTRITRERGAATDAETIVDALWPNGRASRSSSR